MKIGKTYHSFTAEMIDNPIWTKMKLGYWLSSDSINWTRKATLKKGTGNFTGKDERAAQIGEAIQYVDIGYVAHP